jgi:8-oxo-dGTP pyrophosphatase MutT (NUDIX family)
MEKILTFIINKEGKLLLLKGSKNDPQFHKSFWYVVTGSIEPFDRTKEEAVSREVFEETRFKSY